MPLLQNVPIRIDVWNIRYSTLKGYPKDKVLCVFDQSTGEILKLVRIEQLANSTPYVEVMYYE